MKFKIKQLTIVLAYLVLGMNVGLARAEVGKAAAISAVSAPVPASAVNADATCSSRAISADPFESINRKVYKVNKAVDALYIKPISMTYSKVIPRPIKTSVGNFFSNVGEIPNSINHFFQGQLKLSLNNVMRLIVNSTFGVAGMFDMATPLGFPNKRTDFGQTLMSLGYTNSRYIVLPIFGPSTVRDGVGVFANNFISVPYYLRPKWRNRYLIAQFIHNRAELQEIVDIAKTAGVDEYALVREAYLQRRQYLGKNLTMPTAHASELDEEKAAAGFATAPELSGPPE